MTRDEVLNQIDDGTWIAVEFLKASGEVRKLRGRYGVKKYTNGTGKSFNDADKDLITVWEPEKGYRSFKVSRLRKLKAHGKEWVFHG